MTQDKPKPFVIEQLDEALEERQNPDRREAKAEHVENDRRKSDRREQRQASN